MKLSTRGTRKSMCNGRLPRSQHHSAPLPPAAACRLCRRRSNGGLLRHQRDDGICFGRTSAYGRGKLEENSWLVPNSIQCLVGRRCQKSELTVTYSSLLENSTVEAPVGLGFVMFFLFLFWREVKIFHIWGLGLVASRAPWQELTSSNPAILSLDRGRGSDSRPSPRQGSQGSQGSQGRAPLSARSEEGWESHRSSKAGNEKILGKFPTWDILRSEMKPNIGTMLNQWMAERDLGKITRTHLQ